MSESPRFKKILNGEYAASAFQSMTTTVSVNLTSLVTSSISLKKDDFTDYLAIVDTYFMSKAPTGHLTADIPKEFFSSDFRISSQYFASQDSLSETLRSQEKLFESLRTIADSVDSALFLLLSHFDRLLQGLESLNLLESDIFEAAQITDKAKSLTSKVLHNSVILKSFHLTMRREKLLKVRNKLNLLETAKESEKETQVFVSDRKFLSAIDLVEKVKASIANDLGGVRCLEQLTENLDMHKAVLNSALTQDLLESIFLYYSNVSEEKRSEVDSHFNRIVVCAKKRNILQDFIKITLRKKLENLLQIDLIGCGSDLAESEYGGAIGGFFTLDDVKSFIEKLPSDKRHVFIATIFRLCLLEKVPRLKRIYRVLVGNESLLSETVRAVLDEFQASITSILSGLDWETRALSEFILEIDSFMGIFYTDLNRGLKARIDANENGLFYKELRQMALKHVSLIYDALISSTDAELMKEKWELDVNPIGNDVLIFLMQVNAIRESDDQPVKVIKIGKTSFSVVPILSNIIKASSTFLETLTKFQLVSAEVLRFLLLYYRHLQQRLRYFVLDGGAVTEKIRPNITATNIALGSQLLASLAAFIPFLANHILRYCSEQNSYFSKMDSQSNITSLLEEVKFDLTSELQDLNDEFIEKIASILTDRFDQLEFYNYTVESATEKVCKDLVSMYRVLMKSVSPIEVRRVFSISFKSVKSSLLINRSSGQDSRLADFSNQLGAKISEIEGIKAEVRDFVLSAHYELELQVPHSIKKRFSQ
jgi:Vps54-like protein